MQFRWWNSFNLLAVILLAIGITGAIQGQRMVFDPGRPTAGYEWILYVIAGALMLVNGLLPPSHAGEEEDAAAPRPAKKPAVPSVTNATTKTQE